MKRLITVIFLVGILSGCEPVNPIPSYWNDDYAPYMETFGYTFNDGTISKNNIPIWRLPQSCFRFCSTTYVGPNFLYQKLAVDYNASLNQSIELYRAENMEKLGLNEGD